MTEDQDIQVHDGRRAGVVVSVRLKPHEADLLEALSARDGRTLSETLRVALHALATSPGAGKSIGLQGELAPVTRGDWAKPTFSSLFRTARSQPEALGAGARALRPFYYRLDLRSLRPQRPRARDGGAHMVASGDEEPVD